MCLPVLLVSLLWSLVEVHFQTENPYVSFMGDILANHSYVDLTQVENDNSDPGNTVRCMTDLGSCCSSSQGIHRGNWHFPNGDRVQLVSSADDIYGSRGPQRVNLLRRNSATSPFGIYRCDIATVAAHDNNDPSVIQSIYVGVYPSSGGKVYTKRL